MGTDSEKLGSQKAIGWGFDKMRKFRGIGKTQVRYEGKLYKRYKAGYSPWDREFQKEERDPKVFLCECGANYGQYHELGCDCEQCPICKDQLLSCGHGTLFETPNARCR